LKNLYYPYQQLLGLALPFVSTYGLALLASPVRLVEVLTGAFAGAFADAAEAGGSFFNMSIMSCGSSLAAEVFAPDLEL
jgi:hypothetical protein